MRKTSSLIPFFFRNNFFLLLFFDLIIGRGSSVTLAAVDCFYLFSIHPRYGLVHFVELDESKTAGGTYIGEQGKPTQRLR